MQGDVIEIRTGAEILLLGRAGSFARLPRELTYRSLADAVLRRLMAAPEALRQIRLFWSKQYLAQACSMCSDHDILALVDAALRSGQMQAVVLPNRRPHRTQDSEGSRARPAPAVQSSAVRVLRAPLPIQGRTPAAGAPKPTQGPGAETSARTVPVAPRPIGQWSPEERLAEVIRLTVPKVPRAIGNEVLALLTPESLSMTVGIAAFGAAANLTPYGWAADAIIVGIAFGFGGLAAVHGLHDLVDCVRRTGSAVSERDLDEAADALARAVIALTTAGLMAVLHYRARRWGGGQGNEQAGGIGRDVRPAEAKVYKRSELQASHTTDRVRTGIFRTSFKALSEAQALEELKAAEILQDQARTPEQTRQILDSGNDFKPRHFVEGERLYAFDTERPDGGVYKTNRSPYWMSERQYRQLRDEHFKDGKWNSIALKSELALPCYNSADTIVQTEVTKAHDGVSSTIGQAEDLDYFQAPDGKMVQRYKSMSGGAEQITPSQNHISPKFNLFRDNPP